MRRLYAVLFSVATTIGYINTSQSAQETAYGTSESRPIKVKKDGLSGPASERAYLDSLKGPKGQKVSYERTGSCCGFETPDAPLGMAFLDRFQVSYEGSHEAIYLYLDMYSAFEPKAPLPEGFTR